MRWAFALIALLLLPLATASVNTKVVPLGNGTYFISANGTVEGFPGQIVTVNFLIPGEQLPSVVILDNNNSETPNLSGRGPGLFEDRQNIQNQTQEEHLDTDDVQIVTKFAKPKWVDTYFILLAILVVIVIAAIALRQHKPGISRHKATLHFHLKKQANFTPRPILKADATLAEACNAITQNDHSHIIIGGQVLSERAILAMDSPMDHLLDSARPFASQVIQWQGKTMEEAGKIMRVFGKNYLVRNNLMFTISDFLDVLAEMPLSLLTHRVPSMNTIMHPVQLIRADAPLITAIRALVSDDLAVITEDSVPLGVITRRNVISELSLNRKLSGRKAREIMSTSLSSVQREMDILELMKLMVDKGFEAMPVIIEGEVKGIVQRRDLFIAVWDFLQTL
ncbi:MAG: CBS domain-containing protein [Candidatus Woesearchaeota archaeon]